MLSQAASNTTCGTLACIFHTFTMQCCCVGFQFAPLLRTAVGTKERLSTGRPEYYNAASPGIKIISDHTDSDTTSIQITRHLNNQHQSQHFFPKGPTPPKSKMQISQALAILSFALIPLVSADCNSSGQQASQSTRNAMSADAQIDGVCSALIGTYAGGERRSTCIEVGGSKYDFMLHYHESGTRDIWLAECKDGFRKEIKCERGGKTSYGNWEYK